MPTSTFVRRTLGVLALAVALVWIPAAAANDNAGYEDDPLYLGDWNTAVCTHPNPASFCVAGPTNSTTTVEVKPEFPWSGFYVHGLGSSTSNAADGFAITGESSQGTGLFGLAHAGKAAIVARNDSNGVGLSASSQYNDGVFGTTKWLGRSGVYGLNDGGGGWGVVGRSNADGKAAVWGDNTATSNGGNNGVYGTSHGNAASGVYGENLFGGFGVAGRANGTHAAVLADNTGGGDGIEAVAVATGKAALFAHHIHANTGWGIFGLSENGTGIHGEGTVNGVEGKTSNALASGVYGENVGGFGVAGRATGSVGVGVLALNDGGGTALRANGTAVLAGKVNVPTRSGKVVVPAGSSTLTKTGVPLTSASLVIATIQQNVPNLYLRAAVPNTAAGSFTIYLSGNAPAATTIAWFVVN